jgi:hypothetical protein
LKVTPSGEEIVMSASGAQTVAGKNLVRLLKKYFSATYIVPMTVVSEAPLWGRLQTGIEPCCISEEDEMVLIKKRETMDVEGELQRVAILTLLLPQPSTLQLFLS